MRTHGSWLVIAVGVLAMPACAKGAQVEEAKEAQEAKEAKVMKSQMKLGSIAFAANKSIPTIHTCEGEDRSPPLAWSEVPAAAKSLVLIVDDPDAPDPAHPKMTWVHWVLYDLPPSATGLPEAVTRDQLPAGTREGLNDWKKPGYGGPCPPIGRHRYFHKLYALDTLLGPLTPNTKADVEKAMKGHVIDQVELVGTYEKHK